MSRLSGFIPQPDDRLAFLRGFLRRPRDVGSVIPSSRFLERRIVKAAQLEGADCVVELGPGTGGSTRAILASLPPSSRVLAVELDGNFVCLLRNRVKDPRLIVQEGSAEDLPAFLRQHRLAQPKAVISGVPFSTMPKAVGRKVIEAIWQVLPPGGCFVAYQFRRAVAELALPVMGEPELALREFRNMPPMWVFRWTKR